MKISNTLQLTENHRFFVFRDFSLSPLDMKVLQSLYQPMVGAKAVSLYLFLFQQVPAEKIGYSEPELHRKILLSLGESLGEPGRRFLIDETSRLEAVGLLHTLRNYMINTEEYIYEYQLQAPLSPPQFFRTHHLALLLRDCVGKRAVDHLIAQFSSPRPAGFSEKELNREKLSVAFYDLFRVNARETDEQLERAFAEIAAGSADARDEAEEAAPGLYSAEEILLQFPRISANRRHVERLQTDREKLAEVNYVAAKYRLSLLETCRLLDEDGVFDEKGGLQMEQMQYLASLMYRQSRLREEKRDLILHKLDPERKRSSALKTRKAPSPQAASLSPEDCLAVPEELKERFDLIQYNEFLLQRPYLDVLELFFSNHVPEPILDTFERIDLKFRLNEEVINVLIHYLRQENLSWNRRYVETIASDMLGKQIATFRQAVQYVKDRIAAKNRASSRTSSRSVPRQKPKLTAHAGKASAALSEEQYLAILQKYEKGDG